MAGRGSSAVAVSPKVLIVGAGPVGLSLAIELGHRGVSFIVVERNDRVGCAPRAKTTNVRTSEHMRRWGIAGRLAAASPLGVDYPSMQKLETFNMKSSTGTLSALGPTRDASMARAATMCGAFDGAVQRVNGCSAGDHLTVSSHWGSRCGASLGAALRTAF